MTLKADWAYVFTCDQPIESIQAAWNAAGPWEWQLHDSAWYGDYLNTLPTPGVRVRLHEFPSQASEAGVYVGPGTVEGSRYDAGYTVLLQIQADSTGERGEIDQVMRGLMDLVQGNDLKEITPYD